MKASEIRKIRDSFYNPTHTFDRNGFEVSATKPTRTVIYDGTLASLATLVGLYQAGIEPDEIICWDGNVSPDHDPNDEAVKVWLAERMYPDLTVVDWVLPHCSLCNGWGWDILRQMAEVSAAGLTVPDGATHNPHGHRTILSLFDRTGNWSKPYAEAGYEVITIDLEPAATERFNHIQMDVLEQVDYEQEVYDGRTVTTEVVQMTALEALMREWRDSDVVIDGILAAVPCTNFTVANNRKMKPKKGTSAEALAELEISKDLVELTLAVIDFCQPEFWVLENPVGTIKEHFPELGEPTYYKPCQFGHKYSKKTGLWGSYNRDLPMNEVKPVDPSKCPVWNRLGGNSKRTQQLRSITPMGIARAFYEANNWGPQGVDAPVPEYYEDIFDALNQGA